MQFKLWLFWFQVCVGDIIKDEPIFNQYSYIHILLHHQNIHKMTSFPASFFFSVGEKPISKYVGALYRNEQFNLHSAVFKNGYDVQKKHYIY